MTGTLELTAISLYYIRILSQFFWSLALQAEKTLLFVVVVHHSLVLMFLTCQLSVEGQVLHQALGPRADPERLLLPCILVELAALEDALEAACPRAEGKLPTFKAGRLVAAGVLDR